jgi:ABC-type multidrug transport system ATPase subunit
VIAGLREASSGKIMWEGRDLAEQDLEPHEIGYVPQFSIAHEQLTVGESLTAALRLRVRGLSGEQAGHRISRILHDVGIAELEDRRVQLLSGGQRRRLALALEMVSSPRLLLCDEVTSGLDPKAEDEIVKLMHTLAGSNDRIVLSVTHSLRHLSFYDSVLVLYRGCVAYHGSPETLLHYFNVQHADDLFPRLTERQPDEWHRSWQKHGPSYYQACGLDPAAVAESEERARIAAELNRDPAEEPEIGGPAPRKHVMPSGWAQFWVLFSRRWRLFLRDRGQLWLQLALLFGFPCLVVIFALEGLPQLRSFAEAAGGNFMERIQQEAAQRAEFIRAGSLVSGW